MERTTCSTPVRVLIFPLAAQGHVNAMLKLAEIIALAGVHVTFLNTDHINDLLLRHTDVHSRLSRYPGFLFRTISDGLPPDFSRSGEGVMEVLYSMNESLKEIFRKKFISGEFSSEDGPSVRCIIADGILGGFTTDVADELRIPIIHFRTVSACAYWAYFSALDLARSGELPIRGEDDMERVIRGVPGMEDFLRCRDLPGFCRVSDVKNDRQLNMIVHQTHQSPRAQALILNTFEDLEGPIISHVRTKCPNIYSIGPIGPHLNVRLAEATGTTPLTRPTTNLFDLDRSCMMWLDAQPSNSVVYVSFGSIAVLTEDAMLEFLHGLVNSKKRFLWVAREDLRPPMSRELSEAVKERGFVAGWVPQEEVLCHVAVGGFLTHSGWNSTLESIVAGVPMLCWPYLSDQQTNSRFVGEIWKLGIDMKDVCDRNVIEKLINDLMVNKRGEFQSSAIEMARLAKKSVSPGGSSYSSFDQLIQRIKLMGDLH